MISPNSASNSATPKPLPALNEAEEWTRAYEDAQHSPLRLPNPGTIASLMMPFHAQALAAARKVGEVRIVTDPVALPDLRRMGIVEAGEGHHLTAFGMRVLKALKRREP